MTSTTLNLYRSLRIEQFPNGIFIDGEPAVGLLDPDFYRKPLPNGDFRKADVEMFSDANGVEWVKEGGGTSLFDRANVFTAPGWLSFEIPKGTPIPDSLLVCEGEYNKRFKANHYQIQVRANLMTKQAMRGALDNFARSALARSVELAKASGKN